MGFGREFRREFGPAGPLRRRTWEERRPFSDPVLTERLAMQMRMDTLSYNRAYVLSRADLNRTAMQYYTERK